jgi:hypothetical protein
MTASVNVIFMLHPRIVPARDCEGFYVIRGAHAWLAGDRRQALKEFAALVEIEQVRA